MAWVKLDDQAPRNHKILAAGPAAAWMWVCGIAHCQAHLTEGFIADVAISMIGIKGPKRAQRLADVLVMCGLFERVERGYRVHDYLEHNETREEALARRVSLSAKRSVAGRAGGLAKVANAKQTVVANSSPDPTRPDLKETPNPLSPKGGRKPYRRDDMKQAKDFLRINFGRCPHDVKCAQASECRVLLAIHYAQERMSVAV